MYNNTDHTFVICAFEESEYLSSCIESLKRQSIESNIIISTSTPNAFILSIANQYEVSLKVNCSKSSISNDWNNALQHAETRLVTLAHQDDIYLPRYLEKAMQCINQSINPIVFFSHYAEIRNNNVTYNNKLLSIKKRMLKPIKSFPTSKVVRRGVLSFGNPICCPSVMFIEPINLRFSDELKFSLDWQLWESLARRKGSFVYCDEPLILHRIHDNSETTKRIADGKRRQEDYEMLRLFWPKPIAKLLLNSYSRSEKSNLTVQE